MLRPNLRNYLFFFLSALWVLSCSHIGIQSKKDGVISGPIPDCQRNRSKEGGLVSPPVFKTWVKYDHLDFKKGFDLAVKTIQSQGHWILSTDPGSGTIRTQMFLETEQEAGYPTIVKIVEEESSLVVHISLKAAWGTLAPPDLCGFYDELGENVKQASAGMQTKEPVLSSHELPEGIKESSLPSPPPSPPPPSSSPPPPPPAPLSSPPPPAAQDPSLLPVLRGEIIWTYVNVREGPGIRYKIIGKAYRNNTFEILAEDPGWLRVRLENGAVGWVSRKAASEPSATPPSQPPPASSEDPSELETSSKTPSPM